MSDEIRPAMTATEWRVKSFAPDACDSAGVDDKGGLYVYSYRGVQYLDIDDDLALVDFSFRTPEDRHRLAALALHGQPFGFTWADVDTLRAEAWSLPGRMWSVAEDLRSLANRIAALLPPREEK